MERGSLRLAARDQVSSRYRLGEKRGRRYPGSTVNSMADAMRFFLFWIGRLHYARLEGRLQLAVQADGRMGGGGKPGAGDEADDVSRRSSVGKGKQAAGSSRLAASVQGFRSASLILRGRRGRWGAYSDLPRCDVTCSNIEDRHSRERDRAASASRTTVQAAHYKASFSGECGGRVPHLLHIRRVWAWGSDDSDRRASPGATF